MKRNFTLIEILVVMVIISILAGMIVAGIGYVARRGDETKTMVLMQRFQAALDKFADANGYYPPSFENATGTECKPKRIMLRADGNGNLDMMLFNEGDETEGRPYFHFYMKNAQGENENFLLDFAAPQTADWSEAVYLTDAWGNPIWYECPGKVNAKGYDLWSCGPNGEENPTNPRAGDRGEWICNWAVTK